MLASHPSAKKPTSVWFSSPPAKKPILARSFLLQALSTHWRSALVRDLFKEEIDSGQDNNDNGNKAADNDFSLKKFSKDNDE